MTFCYSLLTQTFEMYIVGMVVAVILIGTGFRMMTAFFSVFGSHLTIKERFFIPFAWLPKATVQVSQSISNTSEDQCILQPTV